MFFLSFKCYDRSLFTYSTVPTRYRYNLNQGGLLHHVNRAGTFWNAKSRTNEIQQNFKSTFFFFFGPMREKEGMLFESGGHWSGKRFLVLSFSIQSRAHALNQEGSLEN